MKCSVRLPALLLMLVSMLAIAEPDVPGVASVAALRMLANPATHGARTTVSGFHVAGDGGGGEFYWDSGSTADGDGCTVFAPTGGGPGRWKRIHSGALEVRWCGARGDGVTDDAAAIQAAIDHAKRTVNGVPGTVMLGAGQFRIGRTLVFDTVGITFLGTSEYGRRPLGSTLGGSSIVWVGGAAPMFRITTSLATFKNFSIRNEGRATDWLEMLHGAQHIIFENLSCIGGRGGGGTHMAFSRSLIYSEGSRLGYSTFRHVYFRSPAPKLLYIRNGGRTGVTPFSFEGRCIIDSQVGPMTVVYVENTALDGVSMRNCTFNQAGAELTIFDKTAGAAQNVLTFSFEDNEIDASASSPGWRFFRFRNTANIRMNGNVINGGGRQEYAADLVSSHVASCEGNDYKSLALGLFHPDGASTIEIGSNRRASSGPPEFSVPGAGIARIPYSATIQIDLRASSAQRDGVFEVDVANAAPYSIRVDTSPPQGAIPGQRFTVVIRNVTSESVHAGTFGAGFKTSGPLVAPAPGMSRAYSFYWNGSSAIEISRSAADVAN